MQSIDLEDLLEDRTAAKDFWSRMGVADCSAAHRALVSMARNGVTLDLLNDIVQALKRQLGEQVNPDAGLRNLDRFISSSRSPISLAALLVRDPSALASLLTIFTSSQVLSDLLVQDPESFDLIRLTDGQPVAKQTLIEELQSEIGYVSGSRSLKNGLRRFKNREVLRIAYGEFVRKFDIERTSQQLTVLAEAICEVALSNCLESLKAKYGEPLTPEGVPCTLTLISKGTLGSGDLDYSSPLTLSAIYSAEGLTHGQHKISAGDFFHRLLEELADVLSETNEFGACYEVRFDTPTATAPRKNCASLSEATRIFDQNADAADRLDCVGSRFLCGDQELGRTYLAVIRPLVFKDYLSVTDVVEFQTLRRRIKSPADQDSFMRNIQTHAGGIGDLEFTVRFLQLLVGKKLESVRSGNIFQVLFELEKNAILTQQEMSVLKNNYAFLRRVSHRLQLLQESSTNILPKNSPALETLERLVFEHGEGVPPDGPAQADGQSSELLNRLTRISTENRKILAHLLHQSETDSSGSAADWILDHGSEIEPFKQQLVQLGFANPTAALANIQGLANEKHRFIPNNRCRYFLSSIVSELLREIAATPDPDSTLTQLAQVSDSLGGKATLWELFEVNPSCLRLYVDICAKAPYLANILKSNPGMLDELMDSLMLDGTGPSQLFEQELDVACANSADIQPIVVAFKHSKHLQIGVSQLVRKKTSFEIQQALQAVIDCCIRKMAAHEFEKLASKHGFPSLENSDQPARYGLVLCGARASSPTYHSKSCFWIAYEGDGRTAANSKQKSISNQHFFSLLVTRIAKSISQAGPGGRILELKNIPAFLGDAASIALSLEQLIELATRRKERAAMAVFLTTCRTIESENGFHQRINSQIESALSQFEFTPSDWKAFWEKREKRIPQGELQGNFVRGPGGCETVELISRALFCEKFLQMENGAHHGLGALARILQSLQDSGQISEEHCGLMIDAIQLIHKVQLCFGLMNLPKSAELPNQSGEKAQAAEGLSTDHDSHDADQEARRVTVLQTTLSALMRYDRYDSLAEDIDSCCRDNQRLAKQLYEQLVN